MSLSLVVPVYDDPAGVRAVVKQACDLGIFGQILISDDASPTPLVVEDIFASADTSVPPEIRVLRSDKRQGAGAARNLAVPHVIGSHVLFFDADDVLRPELARFWKEAQHQVFDFCMFQHIEGRRRDEGHLGMFAQDEALWRAADATHPSKILSPQGAAHLVQVAAYPWNKIYRTDFLREHDVRCSETSVHNDIALHWIGFVKAKTILCSNILGCEHILGTSRQHLTHREGAERLQVFVALRDVLRTVGTMHERWRIAFAMFSLNLLTWARDRIEASCLVEFDRQAQSFVTDLMDPQVFDRLNRLNPDMARRALQLIKGNM